MLKTFFKLALLLLLALALAELGRRDPGYIMINWQDYVIETSVLIMIILAIALFAVVMLIKSLLDPITSKLKTIGQPVKVDRHHHMLNQGMMALTDGDWTHAQQRLTKASKHQPVGLVASMGAAKAALELGDHKAMQRHLKQARTIDRKQNEQFRHNITLFEAQAAYTENRHEDTIKLLTSVAEPSRNQPYWRLKTQSLAALGKWHQIYGELPAIRDQHALSDTELTELEANCLRHIMAEQGSETANDFWQSLPAKRRRRSPVAQARFADLVSRGELDAAANLAFEQLQMGVDSSWAACVAGLKHQDWQTRYNQVIKYLGHRDEEIVIQQALAEIAHQGNQRDLAERHLQKALDIDPTNIALQFARFDAGKLDPAQQLAILREQVLGEKPKLMTTTSNQNG